MNAGDTSRVTLIAIFAVIALAAVAVIAWATRPQKPKPHLLDLHQYEADILRQRDRGILAMPPPPIPGLVMGEWTAEDLKAMESNRRVAEEIYMRVRAQ